jgi:hypothetical protein
MSMVIQRCPAAVDLGQLYREQQPDIISHAFCILTQYLASTINILQILLLYCEPIQYNNNDWGGCRARLFKRSEYSPCAPFFTWGD